MAIRKIVSRSITDNTITGSDITPNPIIQGTESIIVPKGTTAQRPASAVEGMLRYNTTLGIYEQYTANGWNGIDAPPMISSVSGAINENTSSTLTINGSNFKSGSVVYVTGAATNSLDRALTTTFVSGTQLTADTNAAGVNYTGGAGYDIKVVNPSGLSTTLQAAGAVDRDPTWTTASGSLATIYDSARAGYVGVSPITVLATDAEGTAVTYAVTTGSLPTGMTLNASTGAITGTPNAVASDTTYTFGITPTSNSQTGVTRNFSITIKAPVVTSFTATGSSTFSVPTGSSSVWVVVVAGGGSGAAGNGTTAGGGAGGMIEMSAYPVTPGGTVSLSVGAGGAEIPNSSGGPGQRGTPTTFGTLTAIGGGGAQGWTGTEPNGKAGGSGGGGAGPSAPTQPGGPGTQPAQPGDSGTYGYGYPGGAATAWAAPYTGAGGGGGGAGAAGTTGVNNTSPGYPIRGNGGNGRVSNITGSPTYYAGGGGGTGQYSDVPNGPGGVGGLGGGGHAGGTSTRPGVVPGQPGTTNTGGGGGAGTWPNTPGGNGGPGVVIVRY